MPADTLALFPDSAHINHTGSLVIGGCEVLRLAAEFGTPLYLYDAATMDHVVETYRSALSRHYPGEAQLAYAAKAWLCTATARWAADRTLGLDVVSGGELAMAQHGGVPPARIHFHGNNKSDAELAQALDAGVGCVVVDHPGELVRLDELALGRGCRQRIWLRINPDVDTDTHRHTQTGHGASKFGLTLRDGTAEATIRDALNRRGVMLTGLHCHIGSQLSDAEPLAAAAQRLLDLAARLRDATGWQPVELSTGGGWAVAYSSQQLPGLPPVETCVARVSEAVVQRCRQHRLALPRLVLEPGRSLVARAGVAVYTVGVVKQAGDVIYAFIDGGLADNPRHALYGARYTALLANRRGGVVRQRVHVAGPYCETGDVLIEDIELPPLTPGDLLAVPVSGAYQLSMASNYNAARRPAVVWIENGEARLIRRRETIDDLLARDL
ncbi:MAG: diaminopimelate decarboxylase [Anaerolineae bacterium]|nr:diaminopimelate decarboxylase [Anaerolineae bacterium]